MRSRSIAWPLAPLLAAVLACANAGEKKDSLATPVPSPSPSPVQTVADLKPKVDELMSTAQKDYSRTDLSVFKRTEDALDQIPKDSKEHDQAVKLSGKLTAKHMEILKYQNLHPPPKSAGPEPERWADGTAPAVDLYLRAVLNDYHNAEYVEWAPSVKVAEKGNEYWLIRLKLRAKNGFGAYILRDTYYWIQDEQVVKAKGLGAND